MIRKLLGLAIFLTAISSWAQVNCEFSNTGSDGGLASVNAFATGGFSAPGGIGAVAFRIMVPCLTQSVGYHVWNVDASASSSPNFYDIGLYCISGDCATGTFANKLYVHTGQIPGRDFTNNRVVATVTGVGAVGAGGTLTLTGAAGSFLPADFPVGGNVVVSTCTPYNNTFVALTVSTTVITVASTGTSTVSGCTVKSSASLLPFTGTANLCTSGSPAENCTMALHWIADGRTVCPSIPCLLPLGIYAAAIGTNCSSATATNCAQLLGEEDRGWLFPLAASATSTGAAYSAGLPATMTFPSIGPTTAIWDTTPGASAPVKPVKLLIY